MVANQIYHIANTWGPAGTFLYINWVVSASSSVTDLGHFHSTMEMGIGYGPGNGAYYSSRYTAKGDFKDFRWSAKQYEYIDTDSDGLVNVRDLDDDNDALSDEQEINIYHMYLLDLHFVATLYKISPEIIPP